MARTAINNLNKSGLLEDDVTTPTVKGFMGNKKSEAQGDDPTSTVAHFVKLVRKQRKELSNANS
jgi:hypothetical protein